MRKISNAVRAAAIAAAGAGSADAAGLAVEHQNAQALGAAYAGAEAHAADAGYAAYNPAAIAGLARAEMSSNATVLWGPTGYENASAALIGGAPVAGLAANDKILPPAFILGAAIAVPVTARLTLGLTITSPFGLRSAYAAGSAARYYAQEASLLTVAVSPTAAFEITPRLSVGASLKVEYMDLVASTVVDAGGLAFLNSVPGFAPGSSDLFSEFKGEDIAVGFTAGFQAQLTDAVRIGFSYVSKVEHDYYGDVRFETAGSTAAQILNAATGIFDPSAFISTLTLPASYSAGVSVAAGERLHLLGSLGLMRWSVFDQSVLTFANPAQPPEIFTSNWSDSWTASIGADYAVSEKTSLRAGFKYDQTPVNDRFAAPRIPDTDRKWLTLGATRRLSDNISLDLAGGMVFGGHRPIRLDGTAPEDLLRGALTADIETDTYAAAMRLRASF